MKGAEVAVIAVVGVVGLGGLALAAYLLLSGTGQAGAASNRGRDIEGGGTRWRGHGGASLSGSASEYSGSGSSSGGLSWSEFSEEWDRLIGGGG